MNDELAKKRFFALALLRFGGVILAFTGISIIAKRWIEPAEVIGGALLVVAIVDVLFLPIILARRWRSTP